MGDKAVEMKVVGFEEYMRLADRMRKRFPDLKSIWLSTEMQVWGFLSLAFFFLSADIIRSPSWIPYCYYSHRKSLIKRDHILIGTFITQMWRAN